MTSKLQIPCFLAAVFVFFFATSLPAALPYSMGEIEDGSGSFSISTDGERNEKQKTILLSASLVTESRKAKTTSTREITVRTGSSKTVGQTLELLTAVFQKFLSNPAPGTVLSEMGSLEKGGAVEFVALSHDVLRLNFQSAAGNSPTDLSRGEVSKYLKLLTKQG